MSRVAQVLAQLDTRESRHVLSIDGHELAVTNLEKVLWPGSGRDSPLTKRELLRYLVRVSPWLLPHLAGRPLFVTRYPNGVTGKSFYQKHWDSPPEYVRTVTIYSSHNEGDGSYLICENLATLLWLAQMAGLELHPWFSRVTAGRTRAATGRRSPARRPTLDESVLNFPDFVVVDLDPYEYSGKEAKGEEPELHRRAFNRTRDLALRIRELLAALGLELFVKTSGRTGLHLYIPILRKLRLRRGARYCRNDRTICPAEVATRCDAGVGSQAAHRKNLLRLQPKQSRQISGFHLLPRRHPLATISMPVTWEQLERIYPTDFTLLTVPELLSRTWRSLGRNPQGQTGSGRLLEQHTAA